MPIRDLLNPDESGNGYALRMVVENGMAYSDLTKALASLGHRYLPNSAARYIAFWFGADPVALSRAIPLSYYTQGQQITNFLGHLFIRPYHIRFTRPQACALCLDEYGFAAAAWDVSLVTCCPKHKVQLIDQCQKCRRFLSWRRPDLWTCHCRAAFPLMDTEQASEDAIWLSQQIEDLLFYRRCAQSNKDISQRLLSAFSLDILLRVIRALGISNDEQGRDLVPGKLTRMLRTDDARQVVTRAFSRLRAILGDMESGSPAGSLHINDLRVLHTEIVGNDSSVLEHVLNLAAAKDARYASLRFKAVQQRLF